jgi:hypothetical protein
LASVAETRGIAEFLRDAAAVGEPNPARLLAVGGETGSDGNTEVKRSGRRVVVERKTHWREASPDGCLYDEGGTLILGNKNAIDLSIESGGKTAWRSGALDGEHEEIFVARGSVIRSLCGEDE